MAQLVVSNLGEVELLDLAVRRAAGSPRGWKLHLYKNDYTPNRDTALADLTESTFPAYAPVDLDDSLWTDPVTNGFTATSQYSTGPVVWTPSSNTGETVYGLYVTFDGETKLLWSQRLFVPFAPTTLFPVTLLLMFASKSQSEPAPP